MQTRVIQESGFVCFCSAWQTNSGKWTPTVTFERLSDHERPLVPSVRYQYTQIEMDNENDALIQAETIAINKARSGDVHFPS